MMAARQHTSTSTRKVDDPELKDTEPTIKLLDSLATLQDFAQTASKHRFKLGTHTHYGPKTHDALVEVLLQKAVDVSRIQRASKTTIHQFVIDGFNSSFQPIFSANIICFWSTRKRLSRRQPS